MKMRKKKHIKRTRPPSQWYPWGEVPQPITSAQIIKDIEAVIAKLRNGGYYGT